MKTAIIPLALSLGASASTLRNQFQECKLEFNAEGGANGCIGQIPEGQCRIGSKYAPVTFTLDKSSGILKDAKGRGCFVTDGAHQQIECGEGNAGSSGWAVENGELKHNGDGSFAACPVNDSNEWNIYKYAIENQLKCLGIHLKGNCGVAAASPSVSAKHEGHGPKHGKTTTSTASLTDCTTSSTAKQKSHAHAKSSECTTSTTATTETHGGKANKEHAAKSECTTISSATKTKGHENSECTTASVHEVKKHWWSWAGKGAGERKETSEASTTSTASKTACDKCAKATECHGHGNGKEQEEHKSIHHEENSKGCKQCSSAGHASCTHSHKATTSKTSTCTGEAKATSTCKFCHGAKHTTCNNCHKTKSSTTTSCTKQAQTKNTWNGLCEYCSSAKHTTCTHSHKTKTSSTTTCTKEAKTTSTCKFCHGAKHTSCTHSYNTKTSETTTCTKSPKTTATCEHCHEEKHTTCTYCHKSQETATCTESAGHKNHKEHGKATVTSKAGKTSSCEESATSKKAHKTSSCDQSTTHKYAKTTSSSCSSSEHVAPTQKPAAKKCSECGTFNVVCKLNCEPEAAKCCGECEKLDRSCFKSCDDKCIQKRNVDLTMGCQNCKHDDDDCKAKCHGEKVKSTTTIPSHAAKPTCNKCAEKAKTTTTTQSAKPTACHSCGKKYNGDKAKAAKPTCNKCAEKAKTETAQAAKPTACQSCGEKFGEKEVNAAKPICHKCAGKSTTTPSQAAKPTACKHCGKKCGEESAHSCKHCGKKFEHESTTSVAKTTTTTDCTKTAEAQKTQAAKKIACQSCGKKFDCNSSNGEKPSLCQTCAGKAKEEQEHKGKGQYYDKSFKGGHKDAEGKNVAAPEVKWELPLPIRLPCSKCPPKAHDCHKTCEEEHDKAEAKMEKRDVDGEEDVEISGPAARAAREKNKGQGENSHSEVNHFSERGEAITQCRCGEGDKHCIKNCVAVEVEKEVVVCEDCEKSADKDGQCAQAKKCKPVQPKPCGSCHKEAEKESCSKSCYYKPQSSASKSQSSTVKPQPTAAKEHEKQCNEHKQEHHEEHKNAPGHKGKQCGEPNKGMKLAFEVPVKQCCHECPKEPKHECHQTCHKCKVQERRGLSPSMEDFLTYPTPGLDLKRRGDTENHEATGKEAKHDEKPSYVHDENAIPCDECAHKDFDCLETCYLRPSPRPSPTPKTTKKKQEAPKKTEEAGAKKGEHKEAEKPKESVKPVACDDCPYKDWSCLESCYLKPSPRSSAKVETTKAAATTSCTQSTQAAAPAKTEAAAPKKVEAKIPEAGALKNDCKCKSEDWNCLVKCYPPPAAPAVPAPAPAAKGEEHKANGEHKPCNKVPGQQYGACPASLDKDFQSPSSLSTLCATSGNAPIPAGNWATISATTSSLYTFDIPAAWVGKTCSVFFFYPSGATCHGKGSASFDATSCGGAAGVAPKKVKHLNDIPMKAGMTYWVADAPCEVGKMGYEISGRDGFELSYNQEAGAKAMGLFVRAC